MRQNVTNCNPDPSETPVATPVERVLRVFGSARASALAGLTTEAIRRWGRPVSKGGQGGLVPARFQAIYLKAAQAERLPLAAEDFIAEPVQ